MDWKKIIYNRGARTVLCIALILAILIGLCYPGGLPAYATIENPIQNEEMDDIASVNVGEQDEPLSVSNVDATTESEEETSTKEEEEITTEQEEETTTEQEEESTEAPEDNSDASPENPDIGPGDGQEDGNQGQEGEETAEFDYAMVMNWYKYGRDSKTIVCGVSETVGKRINTAQLVDNEMKYEFYLTGKDAGSVDIDSVTVQEGNGQAEAVSKSGKIEINLPDANSERDYTFVVGATLKTRDPQGNQIEEEISFTFVIRCYYAMDLELELEWTKIDDSLGVITCAANSTVAKSIESNQIMEGVFAYTPKLTGDLATDARITKAEYMTGSGGRGTLSADGGILVLQTAEDSDEERYYLTFEAEITDEDGDILTSTYNYNILFLDTQDIELSFAWLEKGTTRRTIICQPDNNVSTDLKENQLSAGALTYEMSLAGGDAANARFLNISYESDATGGGILEEKGSIPMSIPEGYLYNKYKISAIVLVNGKQMTFEIIFTLSYDISLQMTYTVKEEGSNVTRTIVCENGKSKTADNIYDDQLTDGILSYEMTLTGADEGGTNINSIRCYQSGSGRIVNLEAEDDVELLLEEGTTGENTFTITASDENGMIYEFEIDIPYKHRGENSIKITTNLVEGQVVTNEAKTNLSVRAWSEDEFGNVMDYIPANGTDTKLIVTLDNEELSYVSTSGSASEFVLYPSNPETGDTNNHTVYIYAEDSYGNYGELKVNLVGQRNQDGQKIGTATIYIDMTALGIGVVDSITCDVLANEPISYTVVKAVMGEDTGEPFGAAANSLGWAGKYSGTLDDSFYLKSLAPGITGNGLKESSWNKYGSSEEKILEAIDQHYGEGTGLATLWRCIYRNGLNKSSGFDGSYSEHDYTSGSGWLFALDGDYYPGLSMSEYCLEDGDVLTLRYTLAFGWDVGGGIEGYGNTIGYCVSAVNGSFSINHQMEKVENADGTHSNVCRCCGLVEECAHANTVLQDLGDGSHIKYCQDCGKYVGDAVEHIWDFTDEQHTCAECGLTEEHSLKEVTGSNTATCLVDGTRKLYCIVCAHEMEEVTSATGHSLNNRWNHNELEHYQKCSVCEGIVEESCGEHEYIYDENDDDWYCKVCDAGHDWDYCGNDKLVVDTATCKKIVCHCSECGLEFTKEGTFPEYHEYVDGACNHCGEADPNAEPDTEEPEPETPDTPETQASESETPGTEETGLE